MKEFSLKIRYASNEPNETNDNGLWLVTCPEDRGIFLAGPDLEKTLSQIPAAIRLLAQARKPNKDTRMNISPNGLAFIEKWEVLKLQAYKPTPDDVWTIGYGHTHGVYEGMVINKNQAIQLLYNDVSSVVVKLSGALEVELTQNQFDAIVSLAFNVGVGGVLRSSAFAYLNAGDFENFKIQAFSREHGWVKQKGHVLEGLVNRRAGEQNLFDNLD